MEKFWPLIIVSFNGQLGEVAKRPKPIGQQEVHLFTAIARQTLGLVTNPVVVL